MASFLGQVARAGSKLARTQEHRHWAVCCCRAGQVLVAGSMIYAWHVADLGTGEPDSW